MLRARGRGVDCYQDPLGDWRRANQARRVSIIILEVAILDVIPEKTTEFESCFSEAQEIISSMKGYISHQLQKCLENQIGIFFWSTGRVLTTIPRVSEARRNIRYGDAYCTTSTIRFQRSSTIDWSAAGRARLSKSGLSGNAADESGLLTAGATPFDDCDPASVVAVPGAGCQDNLTAVRHDKFPGLPYV